MHPATRRLVPFPSSRLARLASRRATSTVPPRAPPAGASASTASSAAATAAPAAPAAATGGSTTSVGNPLVKKFFDVKRELPPHTPRKPLSTPVSYTLQAIMLLGIYLAGSLFPPDFATLLSPRSAPPALDRESPEGQAAMETIEQGLNELEIVKEMRKLCIGGGWYECRPYASLPKHQLQHSLTAGTLRGPSKLAVPPIVFAKPDESEALVVLHLGRSLCGHDGIVHGGMVGTVLDEATGRNALLNLPTKIGVTANLNINYRAPTRADQYVVIRTSLSSLKGRKAVIYAEMASAQSGEILADATAIYIEPKWAKLLVGSGVSELLGQPVGKRSGGSPADDALA